MTTRSTSRQEPTDTATLDTHDEERTHATSKMMKCSETNDTDRTKHLGSNRGASKKKSTNSKMPSEQGRKSSKKSRQKSSNPLQRNGSGSKISKRNRRRKQQFRDPDLLESELRQAYFSSASWVAIRYSVSIEDLIEHLRAGGIHYASRPTMAIQYVEDIVMSVAICKGSKQAWNDLRQVFDLTLNRACTLTMSEQDSVVFVQKFLSRLAEETEQAGEPSGSSGPDDASAPNPSKATGLRGYIGLLPLRVWLTNRILATLEEMPLPESTPATDKGDAARPSLQLVD